MRKTLAYAGAAVAGGALATGLSLALIGSPASAATTTLGIFSGPVSVSNGNASLPEFSGRNDGVLRAVCSGSGQLSGSVVPAIVISRVDPDITRLRIASWGNGTPVVNGTVNVSCVLERLVEAS